MAAPALADLARPLDPERRLAALARAAAPLRRVVAALAGCLVERRAWERLGYARLGDYARERLGLSARSLQELARVDRQLAGLPRLEAALVASELPWSKVRLLARFAARGDEAVWIARARGTSCRRLERDVRAVDRGSLEAGALDSRAPECDEEGNDLEPAERLRIRAPARLCFKWQRTREHAARVAGERIAGGTLLEMITAETLSALPLDAAAGAADAPAAGVSWSDAERATRSSPRSSTRPAEPGPEPPGGGDPGPDPDDAEIPIFLRGLVADLDSADAFALDARLRRAVRLEQRLDAEIAPLLRHVTASAYAWRVRYRTLAAYAREHLGMSPRKARALLRLERVSDVCPALRAAYREGRLSWVQAQVLAPLLVAGVEGDWREVWVRFAEAVTVRRLEEVVDAALLRRETDHAAWRRDLDRPERFAAEGQTCARPTEPGSDTEAGRSALDGCSLTVTAPRDVARLFRAVLCTVRRALERERGQLPSEAEALDRMLDHALATWGAPLRRRYRVFDRDGWRCTAPGCTSRRNLHAHHIVFRSAGGGDELANQTTLCAYHHQRGVHAGTVHLRGRAPDALWFELPLATYGPGERLSPDRRRDRSPRAASAAR